jgi:hypothetical protein
MLRAPSAFLVACAAVAVATTARAQRAGDPPAELRASATASTVDLTWKAPQPPGGGAALAGYRVLRRQGDGASVEIASLPASATAHTDHRLQAGTGYAYTVEARYTRGVKPGAATTTVTTLPGGARAAQAATTEPDAQAPQIQSIARILEGEKLRLTAVAAAAGPAPGGITATARGPTAIGLAWSPAAGATAYDVYRGPTAGGPWTLLTASPVARTGYEDQTLAPVLTAFYRIHARHPDAADGVGTVVSARTLDGHPTGFRASAPAPATVQLTWDPMPRASRYYIAGVGAPPGANSFVTGTSHTIHDVPAGSYEYAILAYFEPVAGFPGEYTTVGATAPRAQVTVAGRRARYRVTLNGFTVDRQTYDDVMQRDGKGDEVFFVTESVELSAGGSILSSQRFTSPVFGDVNGFQNRIRAGSLSSQGGLRTGDQHPSSPPWTRTRAPQQDDLPLILWEGELVEGGNHVLITPSVWEWDGGGDIATQYAAGFEGRRRFYEQNWAFLVLPTVDPVTLTAQQLLRTALVTDVLLALTLNVHFELFGRKNDRPVGVAAGGENGAFTPHVLRLNYEVAEALAKSDLSGKGMGALPLQYRDSDADVAWVAALLGTEPGAYTLWLQVERLP